MSRRFFGKVRSLELQPNTFIGGVAGTINTAALLAAKLSITESDIKDFGINGDDIYCRIETIYVIGSAGFNRNQNITYYVDLGGYITSVGLNTFRLCGALGLIYMPNALIGGSAFTNSTGFKKLVSVQGRSPIGGTPEYNSVFYANTIENLIVNQDTETNNNGGPDGDLTGSGIENLYYSLNNDNPSNITDLSVSSVQATSLGLSFTPPNSANNILGYFLFIDNSLKRFETDQDFNFIDLTPESNYNNITILAVDIMGNVNSFSNSVSATTNLYDFTNLSLVESYGTAIEVDWLFELDNLIDYYEIYVNNVLNTSSYNQKAFIVSLDLDTVYDIKVRGKYINGGYTTFSNTLTTSTSDTYNIPISDITSYYNLNTNSNDQVGSSNGVDTSVSYVDSGGIGNVADFTNSNSSKITISDTDNLSFGNGFQDSPFSGVVRVKFSSTDDQWIINKRSGVNISSGREYQLVLNMGEVRIQFFDQSTGGQKRTITPISIVVGVWYEFGWAYDGVNHPILYVNGLDVGIVSNTGSYTAMENTSSPLVIGNSAWDDTFSLNGYEDELAIFNSNLTPGHFSDIYAKHQAGLALTE